MKTRVPPNPTATADEIVARLQALGDPEHARFVAGYFRTGAGEYAEGDQFLGIRVPVLRGLVREYSGLPLQQTEELLRSPWHEARLLACLLLADAYPRDDAATREAIYRLYMRNTEYINNWDLVDSSAPHVVGAHLQAGDRTVLQELARSDSVWERRIAILATQHFIRGGDFGTTLKIAETLVDDRHDLIHKAVGWMLREVGNRDRAAEEAFLLRHHRTMPRRCCATPSRSFRPTCARSTFGESRAYDRASRLKAEDVAMLPGDGVLRSRRFSTFRRGSAGGT